MFHFHRRRQICTQVSNVKSQVFRHKSQVFQVKSEVKSQVLYIKSQVATHMKLFAMFEYYVTQICVLWTHPTHMTYYGDTLENETNTVPPSTIQKISLSYSTYPLFILQLYEHKGPMKLLRIFYVIYAHRQIISLKVNCIGIVL